MRKMLLAYSKFKPNRVTPRSIAVLALLTVFAFSVYKLADKAYDYYESDKLYDQLRETIATPAAQIASSPEASTDAAEPEPHVTEAHAYVSDDQKARIAEERRQIAAIAAAVEEQRQLAVNPFDQNPELVKLNRDIVGWIKLPHSNIDYPILQTKDNDYYLTRDYRKKKTSVGSIFMDYRNEKSFGDSNTILYGHNMKNKSMFHDLTLFKDQAYFDENKTIYIYTPDEVQRWEIFLVYVTEEKFDYLITKFGSAKEQRNYINAIWKKAYHTRDITLNVNDRILTLSTCSYEYDGARTVVNAKRIE